MSLRVVTVDKNAESRLLNGWLNGENLQVSSSDPPLFFSAFPPSADETTCVTLLQANSPQLSSPSVLPSWPSTFRTRSRPTYLSRAAARRSSDIGFLSKAVCLAPCAD